MPNFPYGESALVPILNDATSMPDPPVRAAVVPWTGAHEGEVEISASVEALITESEIVGGALNSLLVSDDEVNAVLFATDELTVTSHLYEHGDGPVQLVTTDTLPSGLLVEVDYWIGVIDSNTIQLYPTLQGVFDGTAAVSFTDVGTGTHTITAPKALRVKWDSIGFFVSGAGSITIKTTKGRRIRFEHSTRVKLYALIGSMSGTISASVLPVKS